MRTGKRWDWSGRTPLIPILASLAFAAFLVVVSGILGSWQAHNDEVIRRIVWKPGEDPYESPEVTQERLRNIQRAQERRVR